MNNLFCERLKKLRKQADLLQNELALELKISRSKVGHLESGRQEPDLDTLIKIAEFFNVTTDYLLGLESKK